MSSLLECGTTSVEFAVSVYFFWLSWYSTRILFNFKCIIYFWESFLVFNSLTNQNVLNYGDINGKELLFEVGNYPFPFSWVNSASNIYKPWELYIRNDNCNFLLVGWWNVEFYVCSSCQKSRYHVRSLYPKFKTMDCGPRMHNKQSLFFFFFFFFLSFKQCI